MAKKVEVTVQLSTLTGNHLTETLLAEVYTIISKSFSELAPKNNLSPNLNMFSGVEYGKIEETDRGISQAVITLLLSESVDEYRYSDEELTGLILAFAQGLIHSPHTRHIVVGNKIKVIHQS